MKAFPLLRLGRRDPAVVLVRQKLGKRALRSGDLYDAGLEKAVKAFQRENGLEVDGMVGRNTYLALGLLQERQTPTMLMLHCTAQDVAEERVKVEPQAQNIVAYHLGLGWGRCGYHAIIERDGSVVQTVETNLADGFDPTDWAYGAGEYNAYAIHICYVGGVRKGKAKDTRTLHQRIALKNQVMKYLSNFPELVVLGHNQVHRKACPCFSVPKWGEAIGIEQNVSKADKFGIAKKMSI
jgi:hypothetical protein